MKIEFRGLSIKQALPLLVVLFIFLCIYGVVISLCFAPGTMPFPEKVVIATVYTCIILLPCIAALIWLVVNCRIKYILTDTELVSISGKNRRIIPRESIQLIGCAAFARKSAFVFFCWATDEEIVTFANQNWEKRMRLFGRSRVAKLEQTDAGIKQMQISLYLKFSNRDKIILKELESIEQLGDICDFWGVTPVLTGPIILDHPEFWKRFNTKGQGDGSPVP